MVAVLLFLLLYCGCCSLAADQVIYVDQWADDGSNTSSCWEGGESTPCSRLELGLEGIQKVSSTSSKALMIAGGDYELTDNKVSQFVRVSGISIRGYESEYSVNGSDIATIHCIGEVGFSFIYSRDITLSNIVFDGCGQLRNSTTSLDLADMPPTYIQFVVGLYFLYCNNVTMSFVTVQNTFGTGTNIYNTNGNVTINSCIFTNNTFDGRSGGGGLYIEFSYCDPTNDSCLVDGLSNVNQSYTANAMYNITNSNFTSNSANISESNASDGTYILPYGIFHNSFGRGGGMSVYLIGKTSNVSMMINECSFVKNKALWGAGLLVEFHDNANTNNVTVNGSTFSQNTIYYSPSLTSGTGGGGARVAMFMFPSNGSHVHDNNISFNGCLFDSNNAYYGGGLSYYTTLESIFYKPNHFQLYNVNFTSNIARLGAALDMSIFHPSTLGVPPIVDIHDVSIVGNKALYHSKAALAPVGIGAVYIDTLIVEFYGNVQFKSNNGSALVLSGCHITVAKDATFSFIGNNGRSGGAIVLYAGSYIITYPNSHLVFERNIAEYFGGAIYSYNSGVRDQFGSGNCFLRFSDIFCYPDTWTSNFTFKGNIANGYNNSIYVSTILPCVWGSGHGSTDSSNESIDDTFCWGDNWKYFDDNGNRTNCSHQIDTAPAKYHINDTFSMIPGDTIPLGAKALNDLSYDVTSTAVFVLRIINNTASFKGDTQYDYSYVSHNQLSLVGDPNTKATIQFETDNPIIIESVINVTFRPCPPGFSPINQPSGKPACRCDDNYKGHVHCNQSNYTSSIIRSGWIGTVPGYEDTLLFGQSSYIFRNSKKRYMELPQDPAELSEYLCSPSNSRGVLCGSCMDDYGVSVVDITLPCVKCPQGSEKINWIYYLLSEFLPVTIFFGIVFLFSMSVTFGPLNSFIFYAQIITTAMTLDGNGEIFVNAGRMKAIRSAYMSLYSIWNMDFFRTIIPSYCIHPQWNTLIILNLSYFQVLYPILLLFLFVCLMNLYARGVPVVVYLCQPLHYCLARFRQWTNMRHSVTGGMAVFVVIAYTKSVLLALYILTPSHLWYPDGSVATTVFYFDGDIEFGIKNIQYMIPSLIALCLAAIPPLILLYPTLLGVVWHLSCKKLELGRLYPSHKLQAFLDEFHGCYKDGSKPGEIDCRWFASLYFCLRIVLVLVYSVADVYLDQYTAQSLIFVAVAVLFAVFQPYREHWLNQLDIAVFLLLAAISTLSLYNATHVLIDQRPSMIAFNIQFTLVFLPLLYCSGYCLFLFCRKNKNSFEKWRHKRSLRNIQDPDPPLTPDNEREPDDRESYQSALVDSTHVPNFIDFVESAGRMKQKRLRQVNNWSKNTDTPTSGGSSEERTPLLTPASHNEDTY